MASGKCGGERDRAPDRTVVLGNKKSSCTPDADSALQSDAPTLYSSDNTSPGAATAPK